MWVMKPHSTSAWVAQALDRGSQLGAGEGVGKGLADHRLARDRRDLLDDLTAGAGREEAARTSAVGDMDDRRASSTGRHRGAFGSGRPQHRPQAERACRRGTRVGHRSRRSRCLRASAAGRQAAEARAAWGDGSHPASDTDAFPPCRSSDPPRSQTLSSQQAGSPPSSCTTAVCQRIIASSTFQGAEREGYLMADNVELFRQVIDRGFNRGDLSVADNCRGRVCGAPVPAAD